MRLVPLSQNKFAMVDDEDYDWLMQWKWCAMYSKSVNSYYALRNSAKINGRGHHIRMHRVILGLERDDKRHGDHVNHDTLDNRRENLRIATATQNNQNQRLPSTNTSGYKGASLHKSSGLFRATISVVGKRITIGYFNTPEAAHEAYCEAAKKYHGEFARTK